MANIKWDKILGELRESDESITFAGDKSDIFDDTGSDTSKGFTSGKILGELKSLIREYGDNGRLRYDTSLKHWFFEVLDQGKWITKLEIGGSIIVDVVRLIKGEKPVVPAGEAAAFLREITLPNGSKTIRWEFVLDNQKEYGIVVNDQQLDKVVYRRNDGALIHLPNIFKDKNDTPFEDIDEIKFTNGTLTKNGTLLNVSIDTESAPPSDNFRVYYGFHTLTTIDEAKVKSFPSSFINTHINTFTGTQGNPPNYFYIVMPQAKIDSIYSVLQVPGTIPSVWEKGTVTLNGETWGYLRSPHAVYDSSVTFKTLD